MIRNGKITFIYPDTPQGKEWAERLSRDIGSFRIPSPVRKKSGLRRVADTADPWLVVLCSPEARTDPEISRTIDTYIREGRRSRILTLLISGNPADSFPEALVRETLPDGQVVEHEPLAANISAADPEESRKKLKIEKLRILAPMLGVSFDELRNRRHRRRARILLAACAAVLFASAAFLLYAARRVSVISGQNERLNEQYALTESARQEAVSQRNSAREHLAETLALRIRDDRIDNELICLLCLEFLPDSGLSGELPDLFRGALERMCAEGYVPVTRRSAYTQAHGIREEEDDLTLDTETRPARKVTLTVPEDSNRFATESFQLLSWSPEYRYAVYYGGGNPTLYTWIRFLDRPEDSYFLRDEQGNYTVLTGTACLPDGTLIGSHYAWVNGWHDYTCYRYDPFEKRYLPFRSGSPELSDTGAALPEGRISRYADENGVNGFYTADGLSVILGEVPGREDGHYTKSLRIYDPQTLQVLGSIGNAGEIRDIPDAGMLLIQREKTFLICRKSPFEQLFETEEEYTDATYISTCQTACYGDGTRLLVNRIPGELTGRAVYDLNTGERLCVISEPGMDYSMELTGDGRLLNSVGQVPKLWDLKTGAFIAAVPATLSPSPKPLGPVDGVSGLRTSEAIDCAGFVYEYREDAIPVPESTAEQAALARKLLNGRELSEKERANYHLNLR